MNQRDAYVEKMKAKLGEWNSEIARLEARAKGAEADARIEYGEQIESLRKQRDEANAKLEQLRSAGDDAWEDLKSGIDSAWDALGKALESARSRFD